jgi:hypothetical protein
MTSEMVDMAATRARNEAKLLFTVTRVIWGLGAALAKDDTRVREKDIVRKRR